MKRWIAGALVACAGSGVLSAAMVPLRSHLSVATPALVLVVPVVAGVAIGGLVTGLVAVVAGFLLYDVLFLPPYGTLTVGAAQNWTALVVYAVVMLIVARVVAFLHRTQADARRAEDATRRLYQVSDLLIGEQPVAGVLQAIATTLQQACQARWAAVLIPGPDAGGLEVAATAGDPLSPVELARLRPLSGRIESLHWSLGGDARNARQLVRVALTARGRPVGLVAMATAQLDPHQRELIGTYANQAALALERSQLREQALRTELLEQVDHLRAALMGAVSHDLRTPLASVKAAVSELRRPEEDSALSSEDRAELLSLIEEQSDALDRLVANLLDMTRIQSGALELRPAITPIAELVEGGIRASAVAPGTVRVEIPADVPPVVVDQLLMQQVLANLLDNAARHSPEGSPVLVSAEMTTRGVELAVTDCGPGVPPDDRERIFTMFSRTSGTGRAGLGLAIVKAFVEAHGETVRVEDAPGAGARFVVTLRPAPIPAEV